MNISDGDTPAYGDEAEGLEDDSDYYGSEFIGQIRAQASALSLINTYCVHNPFFLLF